MPKLIGEWLTTAASASPERKSAGAEKVDLVVRAGGHAFAVAVNARDDLAALERAAQHLATVKPSGDAPIRLLVVPYMGPQARRWAATREFSWLDLSGNADIRGPGLRIVVSGEPNRYAERGRPTNAFSPHYARVTRVLLTDPSRSWSQRELQLETRLPQGTVSKAVRKLVDLKLVESHARGALHVVNPGLLLDAWAQRYRFEEHHIQRFQAVGRSGPAVTRSIADKLSEHRPTWCATGLSAAWTLTKHADFRLATFYVATPILEPETFGLHIVERGENVWIVTPRDEGVFYKPQIIDGVSCAQPVQVYLDLQAHPERSSAAAAHLRSDLLAWKADVE